MNRTVWNKMIVWIRQSTSFLHKKCQILKTLNDILCSRKSKDDMIHLPHCLYNVSSLKTWGGRKGESVYKILVTSEAYQRVEILSGRLLYSQTFFTSLKRCQIRVVRIKPIGLEPTVASQMAIPPYTINVLIKKVYI